MQLQDLEEGVSICEMEYQYESCVHVFMCVSVYECVCMSVCMSVSARVYVCVNK